LELEEEEEANKNLESYKTNKKRNTLMMKPMIIYTNHLNKILKIL